MVVSLPGDRVMNSRDRLTPMAMHTKPTKVCAITIVSIACQTLRPSEMTDDPVVQPPTLKEPVTIHKPTKSHGPYVLREGGSGRVSFWTYEDWRSVSVSRFTSSLRIILCWSVDCGMTAAGLLKPLVVDISWMETRNRRSPRGSILSPYICCIFFGRLMR
jgi:hypothetical protein